MSKDKTPRDQLKARFNIEFNVPAEDSATSTQTATSLVENKAHHSVDGREHHESARWKVPRCSVPAIEETKLLVPPDGGYGWFIVLGSFVMHIIIGGLERCDGVFFLQFQDKYGGNAQLTAWPGALQGTLRLFLAPVAAAFSNRYSIRACCMVGNILNFVGLILNSFAPNLLFLFFSHSLLQGVGRGLMYTPCLIVINSYFDKRRSLAVGLATSGVGVGTFFILPMTQFLFDHYGYTGAFLITAAWTLNSLVVAMLYRPVSLHYKFTNNKDDKRVVENNDTYGIEDSYDTNVDTLIPGQIVQQRPDLPKPSSSLSFIKLFRNFLTSVFKTCFPKEDRDFVNKNSKKVFHFYLLKDASFSLFCISIMLFTAAFKSAYTFVPPLVKSRGFSDTEAAFVVSVAGVFDTVGRLGVGVCDMKHLRPCRPFFYNLFLMSAAVVSFIIPSLETYSQFCIFSSFYGFLSGGYVAQKSVVIVDILGPENMATSFGMLVCAQGFGMAVGPPLSGAFKDGFGSFSEVFYLGGGFMLLASVFMVSSNVFLRRKGQRSEKEGS